MLGRVRERLRDDVVDRHADGLRHRLELADVELDRQG
jgi:hypothetical protein